MVADQILGHQARGKEKPFDGFIFEVKDNLRDEVRRILARHMRTHGYASYASQGHQSHQFQQANNPIAEWRSLWRRIAVQWAR
jgi:hypothetical protein